MSSLRRVLASKANGARSQGPTSSGGKQRSSRNATSHGLLAKIVVMRDESREAFEEQVNQLVERLQPSDAVELGMVEEMAAAAWRMRRAWAFETRMLDNAVAAEESDLVDRMSAAFTTLANTPALALLHRYETRLHLMYQRSLHNLLLLRVAEVPNEPSPISEHPVVLEVVPLPPDSETES